MRHTVHCVLHHLHGVAMPLYGAAAHPPAGLRLLAAPADAELHKSAHT